VEEISLFAHGEALGVTVSSQEDNDLPSESDLRARLIALMGGRAAEELLFHEVTPGAANDFEKATQIATSMVNRWGMGRDPRAEATGASGRGALRFIAAKRDGNLPSEIQAAATRAIAAILDEAYSSARQTLVDNIDKLRRIGVYLVQEERIDGDTFDALYDGRIEVPDADTEWRPAAARPREWAQINAMATTSQENRLPD
jgi:cell division protease FtsH